jgi:hypothetical protein
MMVAEFDVFDAEAAACDIVEFDSSPPIFDDGISVIVNLTFLKIKKNNKCICYY